MNVNFCAKIPQVIQKVTNDINIARLPEMPCDTFVKSIQSADSETLKLNEIFKKALAFCRESVLKENPLESQMAFDKTGQILYTNVGDATSCKLEADKLVYGSIAVHSHPESCTLSIEDIMVLLTEPKLEKIASVDSKGRYCTMEKTPEFIGISKERTREIYHSLYAKLRTIWQDSLPKIDNPKAVCLEENEKRLMEAFECSTVDELYQKFDTTKTGNPDIDMGNIGWRFYMPEVTSKGITPVETYDPMWSAIALKIKEIDGTDEAIEIGSKVNKACAQSLGLKYEYGEIN